VGEPSPLLHDIHDRMPVMLMPDDYDRSLDPTMTIDDLRPVLKPCDADLMEACEVSRAVNGVKKRHAGMCRAAIPV
jgi:putative SOS response-associated peptidase YedK